MKKRVAIFASGSGTNAEEIFKKFQHHAKVEIVLLLSNNSNAYALQRAQNYNVATKVFDRKTFRETNEIVSILEKEIAKMDAVLLELDYSDEEKTSKSLAEYEKLKSELDDQMSLWEEATEGLMEMD